MSSLSILTVLRDTSPDVLNTRRVDPAGFALRARRWKLWHNVRKEKAAAASAAEKQKMPFHGPGCLKGITKKGKDIQKI